MRLDRHAGPDPASRFSNAASEEEAGCRIKTTEGFADAAARLAGLAGAVLGWRPGEFWDATPAELAVVFAALNPAEEAPPDEGALVRLKEMFPDG